MGPTCSANKGAESANYMAGLSLIIGHEAPMSHRYLADCLDRSIRDIRAEDRPFGGLVFLLGGDFRKIPPFVRRGSRAQIVAESIKRSPLWANMRRRRLTWNVRLAEGGE